MDAENQGDSGTGAGTDGRGSIGTRLLVRGDHSADRP